MEKVLGLDLGTNSIGWAVIGRNEDDTCMLIDRGVHIFQDGVAHDKSGEKPAVQREFNTTFLGIKRREASGLFFLSNIILIFVLIIAN